MEYVKGLLSICCTCYNHEKYIEVFVNSVWNNDYKNVEIIVIDDGSRDKSVEVLERLKAESPCPFTIISQENTHNIGLNFNRTISKARGEFVTFMSADDYYTDDAFSTKLNIMKNDNKIAFVANQINYLLEKNGKAELHKPCENEALSNDMSIDELCEREYLCGTIAVQGNIFRREIIDAVDGFDEDITGDDIIIRTKVLQYMQKNKGWKFVFIDKPAFYYRKHDSQYSTNWKALAGILLDAYDRYWADKPYVEYVKGTILKFIKNCELKDVVEVLSKHPRAFRCVCDDDVLLRCFYNSCKRDLRKKNKYGWIYRKEKIGKKTKLVLFNCIRINLKK